MNYLQLENILLKHVENIKGVEPYKSNNFITPWVVGFVELNKNYKYEISYGTAFRGGWCIGVTLLKNNKPINDLKFNKCFLHTEILDINDFINKIKNTEINMTDAEKTIYKKIIIDTINKVGGYREKTIIKDGFSIEKTVDWNNSIKVLKVIANNENIDVFPEFDFELVKKRITG